MPVNLCSLSFRLKSRHADFDLCFLVCCSLLSLPPPDNANANSLRDSGNSIKKPTENKEEGGKIEKGSPTLSGLDKDQEKGAGGEEEEGDYVLDVNRFPDKVRWLLDEDLAPDAIWWLPKGEAVLVNREVFSEKLLIRHFRGNKFSSVTRNFNRW